MYRVLYFPIAISLLEGVATELIEARFGLKGVAAFIKLLGKIYKEEGVLPGVEQRAMHALCPQIRETNYRMRKCREIVELLIAKDIFDRKNV